MKRRFLIFMVLLMIVVFPIKTFAKEYEGDSLIGTNLILSEGDIISLTGNDIGVLLRINFKGSLYNCIVDINRSDLDFKFQEKEPGYYLLEWNVVKIDDLFNYIDLNNVYKDDILISSDEVLLLIEQLKNNMSSLVSTYSVESVYSTLVDIRKLYINISDSVPNVQLNYLNTYDSNNFNYLKYSFYSDGIKLKELKRSGYTFEGWYLDEDYKYPVNEISGQLMRAYYNREDEFAKICEMDISDGNLGEYDVDSSDLKKVDKCDSKSMNLYAKWSRNYGDNSSSFIDNIINPATYSPIVIVIGFIALCSLGGFIVFFVKKRKM